MIYNTGTIAINGNTATGTGTSWTAPASQVRAGQTIIVMSNPVQMFQISSVNSATSMTVTPAASPALSGQKYGILVSDIISVDGLAQAMSQLINEYDENIGAWETFATTSASQDITVTINGARVTIPAIGKLATKTSGAVPVNQGGTGATSAEDARKNLGLDNVATKSGGAVPVNQGGTGGTTAAKALENLGAASIKDPAFTGTVVAPEFKTSPVGNARINLESSNVNEGVLGRYASFVNSGTVPYVVIAKSASDQTERVFINFPSSGGTLALTGTSDKTYKHDINDMDPLESVRNIQRMRPVTFIFNNDPDKTVRRGVIAQEIQEIDPEYVHLNLDPTDEEGITKERLSLDNNALLLDALIAIKNLADRVEELEGK